MATIVVKNGNWGKARAELKSDLESQRAEFDAKLKAVFAPPAPETEQVKQAAPERKPQQSLSRRLLNKDGRTNLPKSRVLY